MKRPRLLLSLGLLAFALGHGIGHADVTTEWVSIAASSTQQAAAPALRMVREAASAASATARSRRDGTAESAEAAAGRHDAAVAVAAFVVLCHLYPEQREALEWQLAVSFSRIAESGAKADGAAIGRKVAEEMLTGRAIAAAPR